MKVGYDESMSTHQMPPPATPAAAAALPAAAALARRLPKVLLHEHLDGGLRVPTLHALLRAQGLPSPADDADSLARWFDAHAHAGSLEQYLAGFALTVSAMATTQAMEQVAFEAAEDALADGCLLAEFRIAPLLFEAHGVAPEAAVEAMLAGLRRSRLPSGLIVCAMREQPAATSVRAARLALRYRDQGVIGFDLAGPEFGFPPALHADALKRVRDAGLGITLHAGEADGAARVLEAAELGATRIGHGVRLADALAPGGDRDLFDRVLRSGVHLEVCPTSNVHTGAYASLAAHPIGELWRAGVSLSFHTDNRLMSATTMAGEAEALVRECALTLADLAAMSLAAADASFLPADDRARARAAVLAWAAAESLAVAAG
jgi:adenosine deaminase